MSEIKITLKAARVNAGLTLNEAAKLLGIARTTLVSWEKNPEKISALYQGKIGDVYNIDTDNIIFLAQD